MVIKILLQGRISTLHYALLSELSATEVWYSSPSLHPPTHPQTSELLLLYFYFCLLLEAAIIQLSWYSPCGGGSWLVAMVPHTWLWL